MDGSWKPSGVVGGSKQDSTSMAGSTPMETETGSGRPSSSFLRPNRSATRARLASTPMATDAPGWPLTLWNSMAGPSTVVGRMTVPPAPTWRYTPDSSAAGSTSTPVSTSWPGVFRSTSKAVRRSKISVR